MKKLILIFALFASVAVCKATDPMCEMGEMTVVDTSANISGKTLADIRFAEISSEIEKARLAANKPSFSTIVADSMVPLAGTAIPICVTYFVMLFIFRIMDSRYRMLAKFAETGNPIPAWMEKKYGRTAQQSTTYLTMFIVFTVAAMLMFIGISYNLSSGESLLAIVFGVATLILIAAAFAFFRLYLAETKK